MGCVLHCVDIYVAVLSSTHTQWYYNTSVKHAVGLVTNVYIAASAEMHCLILLSQKWWAQIPSMLKMTKQVSMQQVQHIC